MKTLKFRLLSLILTLGLAALSSQSLAAVYVCSNDDCSTWTPIDEGQFSKKPGKEDTTIREVLHQSESPSVTNGYNNIANTNLYLKNSLWHLGGPAPFADTEHVTVYIYKSTNPNDRIKTCHVFSIKRPSSDRYFTTCE